MYISIYEIHTYISIYNNRFTHIDMNICCRRPSGCLSLNAEPLSLHYLNWTLSPCTYMHKDGYTISLSLQLSLSDVNEAS